MAETTKTTASKSKVDDNLLQTLMAQLEAQNKIIQEMQSKLDASEKSNYIKTEESFGGKKVKVINMMHNILNLSTEPDGQGRSYTFENMAIQE